MYRRILVLLDGSARSERILPHVEEMARLFGSTVLLLKVVEPFHVSLLNPDPYIDGHIRAVEEERAAETMCYLNSRCGELRSRKINARPVAACGSVIRSILETAAHQNVDVIMMASHGRDGLDSLLHGSVAEGLLRHTERPLLLIRADG